MRLFRRLRIPALFCSLAVLLCERIGRPFANMGICDDGPYILMARTLATTGHIVYNGGEAAMLLLQLYLGAAFIKLFGFSLTTVRMSALLISLLTAFLLQRSLVRAGITELNATIATLALVLSPLYLMISPTFMSDIFGLFAIVVCLYGCLRALRSLRDRATIVWLIFAVVANALFGTSRQIAWLGILVMIPSALWLLRFRRSVLLAGIASVIAGMIFIVACVLWLKHQPYLIPVPLPSRRFPVGLAIKQLTLLLLEIPFLLLPITAIFLPQVPKTRSRPAAVLFLMVLGFAFLSAYPSHFRGKFQTFLEPTSRDWVTASGIYIGSMLHGNPLVYIPLWMRLLVTVVAYGGVIGLAITWLRSPETSLSTAPQGRITKSQLVVLLLPYTVAYLLLLLINVGTNSNIFDRYALALLIVVLLGSVRLYQDHLQPRLPIVSVVLVLVMAIYGVAVTRDNFSFYRARIALADELHDSGVPATSVDNGWEYNFDTELQYSNHINDPRMVVPADAYIPVPQPPGACQMFWYNKTPHIHPRYGVSFDSHTCYGPAPFAPVHYSRWLASKPGTLYAVRYAP